MERIELKKTKSLSPVSFEEVDARVVVEDGIVYLEKEDENGEHHKSFVERDVDFYKTQTSYQVDEQVDARHLLLYVSSKCNLNCPLCYENVKGKEEVSLEEIKNIAAQNKKKIIVLMGREPTCRKDILEVIRILAKDNRVTLLTNGIKLAKYEFAAQLKEAGLTQIIFSFNGFDDEIYKKMNGKPLLETKLQALSNIKKLGIKTLLSITLARGVNDKELKDICQYCFDNRSFIFQLRVRTATTLGRHMEEVESYCMTEMLELLANQLEISYDDILKEQAFWNTFVDEFDKVFPSNAIATLLKNRLCSFIFTVRRDRVTRQFSSLASRIDMDAIAAAKFKKPLILYNLIKAFGPRGIAQNIARMLKLPLPVGESDHLMIFLRCWPNIYTIDLEENKKCPSRYLKDGEFLPFCYANILDTFRQRTPCQD